MQRDLRNFSLRNKARRRPRDVARNYLDSNKHERRERRRGRTKWRELRREREIGRRKNARRSSSISTSLTCAWTFPIFIYDPRARAPVRSRGKLDWKSFAGFRKGEYKMRAGVYVSVGARAISNEIGESFRGKLRRYARSDHRGLYRTSSRLRSRKSRAGYTAWDSSAAVVKEMNDGRSWESEGGRNFSVNYRRPNSQNNRVVSPDSRFVSVTCDFNYISKSTHACVREIPAWYFDLLGERIANSIEMRNLSAGRIERDCVTDAINASDCNPYEKRDISHNRWLAIIFNRSYLSLSIWL